MAGIPCDDADPSEDDDGDGWWDAAEEWLGDDDLYGMASDGDFGQATQIFSAHGCWKMKQVLYYFLDLVS